METQLIYQGCGWYYVTMNGEKRGPFTSYREAEDKAREYYKQEQARQEGR